MTRKNKPKRKARVVQAKIGGKYCRHRRNVVGSEAGQGEPHDPDAITSSTPPEDLDDKAEDDDPEVDPMVDEMVGWFFEHHFDPQNGMMLVQSLDLLAKFRNRYVHVGSVLADEFSFDESLREKAAKRIESACMGWGWVRKE